MKSLVYVFVAASVAVAGFAIYRYAIAPRIEPPAIQQQATPTASATPSESPVPTELPDFSLPDIDGKSTSIRGWTGKSMIVNFWATWCAPCRREIPLLRQIQKDHAAAGFQVVGVAGDFHDDVVKYAREIGIDYPVLIDENLAAATQFGLGSIGFPFTVFTDNRGRIVATHLGELTQPQSAILIEVVGRVNAGELTPASARSVAARQLQQLGPPAS